MTTNTTRPRSFAALMAEIERDRIKRRLQAALRRKPKPAKVKPQDEHQP